jgi:hypothetical protein
MPSYNHETLYEKSLSFDSTPYINTVLNNLHYTASHCIASQDMDEANYVADYILNGGDKVPPLLLNVPT